ARRCARIAVGHAVDGRGAAQAFRCAGAATRRQAATRGGRDAVAGHDQGDRRADQASRLAARAIVRSGTGGGPGAAGSLRRTGIAAAFLRLSTPPQLHGAAAAAVPAGAAEITGGKSADLNNWI